MFRWDLFLYCFKCIDKKTWYFMRFFSLSQEMLMIALYIYILMIGFFKICKKNSIQGLLTNFSKKYSKNYDYHFHELHFDSTLCHLLHILATYSRTSSRTDFLVENRSKICHIIVERRTLICSVFVPLLSATRVRWSFAVFRQFFEISTIDYLLWNHRK